MKKQKKITTVTDTPEQSWVVRMRNKAVFAVIAATAGALLNIYTDALKPVITSAWPWMQDQVQPLSDDKIIGVELRFYIPTSVDKNRSFEAVSATLWPNKCKRPEGASVMNTFDSGTRDSYTNAIVNITCRASGRTRVTLTPQNGSIATLYDGVFKDGEKISFAGVPGSYYAGILTFHFLNTKMPDGPRRSVNKCQITNTCAEEFAKDKS